MKSRLRIEWTSWLWCTLLPLGTACASADPEASPEGIREEAEALSSCPTKGAWPTAMCGPQTPLMWDFDPWPNGVVKYELVNNWNWSAAAIQNLANTMAEWSNATSGLITFVPNGSAPDRLKISNTGCAEGTGPGYHPDGSILGVSPDGGTDACSKHDLGHILGAGHEHVRSDRDRYVAIDRTAFGDPDHCASILQLADGGGTTDYGIYNTRSIMHYDTGGGATPYMWALDDCSTWRWDIDVKNVAPQDGSNLVEMYAQKQLGWERFRPLGIYTDDTTKLDNKLAAGVAATGSPALSSQQAGALDLFVRGSNSHIYHRWCSSGCGDVALQTNRLVGWVPTTSWEDLSSGNTFLGSPSSVSWSSGDVELVARTANGVLWRSWSNSGWASWKNLGKLGETFPGLSITGGPALASRAASSLDLFVRGSDGKIYGKHYGGSWDAWKVISSPPSGVTFTGDPAAIATSSSKMEVYSMASNGTVYYKGYSSGTWESSWHTAGTGANSSFGPTLAVPGDGTVHVFTRGNDNRLWQRFRDASGSWVGWYPLGGEIGSGAPAAHARPGHLDVVVVGTVYLHAETEMGLRYRYFPR